jgi:hypothetical protein
MRTPATLLTVLAGVAALVLALATTAAVLAKAGPAFIDGVPNDGQMAPPPARSAIAAVAPAPAAAGAGAAGSTTTAAAPAAGSGRGIFVPKPKGAGDTLDDTFDVTTAAGGVPEDRPDVVTTRRGDQVHGSVLGVNPRGSLRISSPEFEGELLLAPAELARIDLHGVGGAAVRPAEPKAGQPKPTQADIVLAGGDRVTGTLVTLGTDAVTIDTPVAGRLRIAAAAVRSIGFHRADVLVDSAFGAGVLGQWTDGGQNVWTAVDGAITNGSRNVAVARGEMAGALMAARGGMVSTLESPLYAPLDQAEAVTIVAKVTSADPTTGPRVSSSYGFSCDLVLFADAPGGSSRVRRYGRSSIFGVFGSSQAYPVVNLNGSSGTMLGTRSYGHQLTGGILRFAYDPATSKAQLWVDEVSLGSYTVPNPPPGGKYVMFNSLSPVRVESLRVLRGVVPPEDDGFITALPPPGQTVVELATKERLTVTRVVMEGGQVTLATVGGEVRYPIEKVRCILYGGPDKAATATPATTGQGQVRTDGCWLTLKLVQITDGEVTGRSDVLGDVKIRRAAVREIWFSTDQAAGASKTTAPATGSSSPAVPVPARVMLPRAAILP